MFEGKLDPEWLVNHWAPELDAWAGVPYYGRELNWYFDAIVPSSTPRPRAFAVNAYTSQHVDILVEGGILMYIEGTDGHAVTQTELGKELGDLWLLMKRI